jgi:hypothetical protein
VYSALLLYGFVANPLPVPTQCVGVARPIDNGERLVQRDLWPGRGVSISIGSIALKMLTCRVVT